MGKQKSKPPKKHGAAQQQLLFNQHRKEYDQHMWQLLRRLDAEWIYALIGSKRRDMLYDFRPLKLNLQQKGGSPHKMLNEYINATFTNLISNHEILYDKKTPISLHDSLYYLFILIQVIDVMCNAKEIDPTDNAPLQAFRDSCNSNYNIMYERIGTYCKFFAVNFMGEQNPYIRFYPLNTSRDHVESENIPKHRRFRSTTIIEYDIIPIPTKKITINGNARTCFRLGFPDENFELAWVSVQASTIGLKGKRNFPVYCQRHAAIRIEERLSPFTYFECMMMTATSISANTPVVHINRNTYLFPVYFDKMKIGYYLASLCDEIIVLRTFLFITSSGTPEGKKLDQLTGFTKLDKTFLAIDKISSMLNLKIEDDPELMAIFQESDLAHLITDNMRIMINRNDEEKLPHFPDLLHDYLNLYKQYKQEDSSWKTEIEPATCNDEQVQEAMLDNDVELQSHQSNIKVGSMEEKS
jgi:hypothetical protein